MNSQRYWKNSLKQIHNGLDKADATLDALNKNSNCEGVLSKEIYKSPDTLVEVNIRTKKKSSKSPHKSNLGKPSSKLHRTPKKSSGKTPTKASPLNNSNNYDSGGRKVVTFQQRTLKLVLGEIKSILKQGQVEQALQHLEDVEYIALNLNSEGLKTSGASPCKKLHVSESIDELDSHRKMGRNKELERELAQTIVKLDQALRVKAELHNTLDSQEKKMDEMKGLISRLSSTNEDMVLHLKEKIRLEDSLKVLEASNQHLALKYEKAIAQNSQAQKVLGDKESEIRALHKIIKDMKKAFSQDDFNVLERPIKHISFSEEAPSLSSELSKISLMSSASAKSGHNIESTDEGVFSESVALPHRSPPTKGITTPPSLSSKSLLPTSEEMSLYGESASSVKSNLNTQVHDFLERMKKGSPLDVSLPEPPQRRSFDENSLPLNLTEESMDQLASSKLTSESSLTFSSNDSTTT